MLEKIKIFDALSKLIPGILLMSFFVPFGIFMFDAASQFKTIANDYKDFSTLLTTIFLVFSFLIGYFISALASELEPTLFKLWGGRASSLLLRNKVKTKPLSNREGVLDFLITETANPIISEKTLDKFEEKDFGKLFQTAKNYCLNKGKDGKFSERIEDFENAYIFSRNIFFSFITVLISSLLLFQKLPVITTIYTIFFVFILTILSFFRCKKQSIYHTREVFTTAFSLFKNPPIASVPSQKT